MAQHQPRRFRSRRLVPLAVLGVAALAIAAVWIAFVLEVRKDEAHARHTAEIRLDSMAKALAEQAERSLAGINVASLYLRHAWATNREHFAEIVDTLRPASAATDVNVMVNDGAGGVSFSTYPRSAETLNFAEREHFRAQAGSAEDRLFISKPVMGKISRRLMIPCSRKLSDAHGRFDGIVVIAITPEDLFRVEDAPSLGQHGGATLIGLDGVVRGSSARAAGNTPAVGQSIPLDRPYLTQAHGVVEAEGLAEGERRLYAFRRLSQFPLTMVVSDTVEDVLAATLPHRRELGLFAIIATALIAGGALVTAHFIHTLSSRNRALDRARRHSELILASAGEGICGFDGPGCLTFINPAARRMLGWDAADEATRAQLAAQLRDMHLSGEAKGTLARADGTWFPCEMTAAALVGHDRADGSVVVFRDVTRAVQTEQALIDQSNALTRSNAELEQFAYVASHDLREPLRMVSSFLTLLEKRLAGTLDQDGAEFLHFARDGAQRMDRLVLDLLEYSRIGRQDRPMAAVDLGAVMTEVGNTLTAALAETGGTVTVSTPLPVVTGDGGELTRLLQNLVGNALKYHDPTRAPAVEVSAARDGGEWHVSVRDNGIGIAPENFTRVFGVFQRLHSRDQYDGTGIGLAICKKVVEHHGGRIWVDSAPGQGSTFTFSLPVSCAESGA